jgi:hypothetical protein
MSFTEKKIKKKIAIPNSEFLTITKKHLLLEHINTLKPSLRWFLSIMCFSKFEILKFYSRNFTLHPKPQLCPKFQVFKATEKSTRLISVKGGGGGNAAW